MSRRAGGEVHVLNSAGLVVQTFAPPSGPSQVIGIVVDDAGSAYVAGMDGRIYIFGNDGVFDRVIIGPQGFPICCLLFVELSPDQTQLFVTDNSRFGQGVHHFDLTNGDAYLGFYGATKANSGVLAQVAFAPDGTLYVTDDVSSKVTAPSKNTIPTGPSAALRNGTRRVIGLAITRIPEQIDLMKLPWQRESCSCSFA
jgi:hypothetical protein